ncbi:MAG: SDR family oxidoreductase [Fusobacterium perfoetens]|uniref:SDR family NAD(P)-dependent oxidoreductase n=1 Tax=Fusobacterium perfoetens TaxID=852 RepID=UPI0023F454A3|nr:SDR family oxidoreductase [Fusobacterium perfoetens]MCI6153232.1 SDR family oxidoreductase [Fusobacterium perfoetens]MDY3238333.1 SDR family oxidoreductase [Fusobacterium perfoetens]
MKRVIITGGAKGIGKALVEGFAQKGYDVFALDILENNFGNKNIHFFKMDLKNEKEIKNIFQMIKEKFGEVHILINNGAISKFNKSITEIEINEFDEVINTNLRGSFICCKEFIKINNGASFGRIINIASTRFNQNEAGWEAYGSSKGGIVSLTNTLCVSLSGTGITVNAISPGWIEVEDYESLREKDHSQHPSGRVGKPKDIVNLCLFLSNEENDFINGANILVDGGMTKKMIYLD